MDKKIGIISAVAVGALAMMGACSSGGNGGTDSGDVHVTVWARAASIAGDAEERLQAEFPDWQFTVARMSDIDDKLRNGFRASSGLPDVAIIGGNLPTYFEVSDQFLDLTEHGFTDEGQYVEWALKSAQDENGTQIGLPTDIGPYALFYRADIVEKLGYSPDPTELAQELTTIEDYTELSRKAREDGKYACDAANSLYQLVLLQNEYQYYINDDGTVINDIESSVNEEAFALAADYVEEDLCTQVNPYSPEWNSAIAQEELIAFIGPGYEEGILKPAVGEATDQWRVTQTPGGYAASTGSFATALSSSANTDAAAQVAMFLASGEEQAHAYTTHGLFPAASSTYTDDAIVGGDPFYGGQEAFSVLAHVATEAPYAFRAAGSALLGAQFRSALDEVVQLGKDPAEAYEDVVQSNLEFMG